MRAHFGAEVAMIPSTPDDELMPKPAVAQEEGICGEKEDLPEVSLEQRVLEFKQDSKSMELVSEFIEEVLQKAGDEVQQRESAKRKNLQQAKEKSRQSFSIPDFKNGKVVNRARGLVVRIFDAIGKACVGAAATPVPRIKLRVKRSSGNAAAGANGTAEATEGRSSEATKDTKVKKIDKESMAAQEVAK